VPKQVRKIQKEGFFRNLLTKTWNLDELIPLPPHDIPRNSSYTNALGDKEILAFHYTVSTNIGEKARSVTPTRIFCV